MTLSLAVWGCSGSALVMGYQDCPPALQEQPIPIPFQAGAMGDHPQGEGQGDTVPCRAMPLVLGRSTGKQRSQ